ncbi:MAG: serine/threonine protein kinase [Gammaproteobacteria bacterium]|nr:serine/threonine protein kinase [Gammaproteobacteria bacterium]
MRQLRHEFAAILPHVQITEHDPEQQGKPGLDFDWSLYDLIVIEDGVMGSESGLAWLAVYSLDARLPPALLVADDLDPFVRAKVNSIPHTLYIRKADLDRQRLPGLLAAVGVSSSAESDINDAVIDEQENIEALIDLGITTRNLRAAPESSYRFVRLIGQGGYSKAYLAERVDDGAVMVLKVMELEGLDDPTQIARFESEATVLSEIDSRHVVKLHDFGFTQKYGYLALEFFTRGDLKHRIEQGMRVSTALHHMLSIARGLEKIHAHNIVHRDIKPANIMFRADDSLAIADFGLAKHLGDRVGLTKTGFIVGTLNYLSPEQGLGRALDQRSDLYSAGIILFEMLTGRKPFVAATPFDMVKLHQTAPIPKLPDELRQYQGMVDGLLAKDPDKRFYTARELIAHLKTHISALKARQLAAARLADEGARR